MLAFIILSVILWPGSLQTEKDSPAVVCRTNEVLNKCYSPCEKDCKTRFRSDGRVCTTACSVGCSCVEGYLKDNLGRCVLINECQTPLCNSDEVYSECGTACQSNCTNFDESVLCTRQCVQGCFCKEGTIRLTSDDSKCVKPSSCPYS